MEAAGSTETLVHIYQITRGLVLKNFNKE